MTKTGFIGYGHMGSVLLNALLDTGAIAASDLLVATRTANKLAGLKTKYTAVGIAEDNRLVADLCDPVFLCVGTYQVQPVLMDIRDRMHADSHLVLISGGVEITAVERVYSGPLTRIMPTLLAEVRAGVTLVCHNSREPAGTRNRLREMLSRIGAVKEIPESSFDLFAVFTSCAPGLLAAICEQFVQARIHSGGISANDARAMLVESLYGTAKLLREKQEGFRELTARVATPGGATEGGADVLNTGLPEVFRQMFAAIGERHDARKQVTRRQFGEMV
jgi:pyrroline-5-carboxylate reductase